MAAFNEKFLFNQSDTAKLFNVSLTAFQKWDIEPYERRGRQVFYYLPDVIYQRGAGAKDNNKPVDAVAEKARLDRVRADRVELELQRERREVVMVDEAAELLQGVVGAFRMKILGLPTKLAPLVHGCKTLTKTKAVLTDALDESLSELARLDVAALYRSEDGRDGGAAAEADAQRVGRSEKAAKPRGKRRTR
jgi:phage terminase Nu1 subunit (DNA packaging protein)